MSDLVWAIIHRREPDPPLILRKFLSRGDALNVMQRALQQHTSYTRAHCGLAAERRELNWITACLAVAPFHASGRMFIP